MKSACRSPAGTSLNDGRASRGPFVPESATGEPFLPAGVPDEAAPFAAAGCVEGFRAAGGAAPLAAGLDESPPCAQREAQYACVFGLGRAAARCGGAPASF